jgi:hypothetical protein
MEGYPMTALATGNVLADIKKWAPEGSQLRADIDAYKSTRALQVLATRIPGDLKARLRAYCQEHGMPMAYVFRRALTDFMAQNPNPKGPVGLRKP